MLPPEMEMAPPEPGSGKLVTPCARMHCANLSAPDALFPVLVDAFPPDAAVVAELAESCATPGVEPPLQAETNRPSRSRRIVEYQTRFDLMFVPLVASGVWCGCTHRGVSSQLRRVHRKPTGSWCSLPTDATWVQRGQAHLWGTCACS